MPDDSFQGPGARSQRSGAPVRPDTLRYRRRGFAGLAGVLRYLHHATNHPVVRQGSRPDRYNTVGRDPEQPHTHLRWVRRAGSCGNDFAGTDGSGVPDELPLVALCGQSVGKMMTGVRVDRFDNGYLPGWGRSTRRWLVLYGPMMIPLVGWIIVLVIYFVPSKLDPHGRALHDRLAGTTAITRSSSGTSLDSSCFPTNPPQKTTSSHFHGLCCMHRTGEGRVRGNRFAEGTVVPGQESAKRLLFCPDKPRA